MSQGFSRLTIASTSVKDFVARFSGCDTMKRLLPPHHYNYDNRNDPTFEDFEFRNREDFADSVRRICEICKDRPGLKGLSEKQWDDLNLFARNLTKRPEIERRLMTRVPSRYHGAFPIVACVSHLLGLTTTPKACVERYGALLKNDASDDLLSFILQEDEWLRLQRERPSLSKADVIEAILAKEASNNN